MNWFALVCIYISALRGSEKVAKQSILRSTGHAEVLVVPKYEPERWKHQKQDRHRI
jgi:hypothetical protein